MAERWESSWVLSSEPKRTIVRPGGDMDRTTGWTLHKWPPAASYTPCTTSRTAPASGGSPSEATSPWLHPTEASLSHAPKKKNASKNILAFEVVYSRRSDRLGVVR